MTRKDSLTGSILERWLADGKPSLTWDDLVHRTIDADIEFERRGLTPAPAFRRHRLRGDSIKMQRYVAGFYEYEYSPNYNPRKHGATFAPKRAKPEARPAKIPTIDETPESSADFVIKMFRRVEKLLRKFEDRGAGRDAVNWINDLEKKGRIPKRISFRMHSIRLTRNRVVHEMCDLSAAERTALIADWETIDEWWKTIG